MASKQTQFSHIFIYNWYLIQNLDVLSPSELEMLLNTYDDVFQKPLGFPP